MPAALQLYAFQKKALRRILKEIFVNNNKTVTLKSPTGSGKTVMLSKLTDVILDIREFGSNAASISELDFSDEELQQFDFSAIQTDTDTLEYIWLSPSTGGLAGQSKTSFERNIGSTAFSVQEFVQHADTDEGIITFIGVSSINQDDNILRRDSEKLNWTDVLDIKHTNGTKFGMIIDECHLGDTEKRAQIIEEIDPSFIIKASATPVLSKDDVVVEVTDEEVIEEGLITKRIRINHELPAATYESQEHKNLIKAAVQTYKKLRNKYIAANGGNSEDAVNPLIIIQYPDRYYGDELFEEMNRYIKELGFSDDEIAKWLTVKGGMQKENLTGISDNDSPIVFLHMKQAAATGWDCPRAKILIKLRDISSTTFETQVIGRIRRMPERKHYNDKDLDSCYIYTYDDKWISRGESEGTFTESRIVTFKPLGKPIAQMFDGKVMKEYKDDSNSILGTAELRQLLEKKFIEKYELDPENKEKNAMLLKSHKYRITDRSNIFIRHGDAETITEIKDIDLEMRRRVVRDGDNALRQAKEEISRKSKLNDAVVTSRILQALFRKQDNPRSRDVKGTLLELNNREYNAFIVNNAKLLSSDFKEFLQKSMNQSLLRSQIAITTRLYSFPESYEIKCDTRLQKTPYSKNLYDGVDTTMKTSAVESHFQDWLESNADWWVKNGDVGEEFLSIVYITATGKEYCFYPDYLCSINQHLWIVETKGGETADQSSANIDPQAENKFYALKDWAAENTSVKVAFVRYSAFQNELYASDTDYQEDMCTDQLSFVTPWKEIEEILK